MSKDPIKAGVELTCRHNIKQDHQIPDSEFPISLKPGRSRLVGKTKTHLKRTNLRQVSNKTALIQKYNRQHKEAYDRPNNRTKTRKQLAT